MTMSLLTACRCTQSTSQIDDNFAYRSLHIPPEVVSIKTFDGISDLPLMHIVGISDKELHNKWVFRTFFVILITSIHLPKLAATPDIFNPLSSSGMCAADKRPFIGDGLSDSQRKVIESIYGGADYKVWIRAEGSNEDEDWRSIFVYRTDNARGENWFQTTSSNQWASFDMEDDDTRMEVRVGLTNGKKVEGVVEVKPRKNAPNVKSMDCGDVFVVMDRPGQFWIKVPGMEKHPLFLFVNPREKDVPDVSDDGVVVVDVDSNYREVFEDAKKKPGCELVVLRFTPGVHFVGSAKEVFKKENFTIYLPYGSVLVGTFVDTDLTNVTIRGRGIIDGGNGKMKWPANPTGYCKPKNVDEPAKNHENVTDFTGKGKRVIIKGITMLSTRGFLLRCFSENSEYSNLKLMGWSYNTDGVGLYRNATCTNSFFKVNDDCFKLGSGTVRKCVIWQLHNAHVWTARIWSKSEMKDVNVLDCDIIRREQGNGGSIFAIRGHLGGGEYHKFRFEDIRIDSDVDRFIDFAPTREYYPDKPLEAQEESLSRTVLHKFLFKKIVWNGRAKRPSWFRCGLKSTVHHITFEDCVVNGEALTSIRDLNKENGFHSFTGYGDIRDVCFIANGKETMHASPSDELGGWQVKTENGTIPVFTIDGKLPEGSFQTSQNGACRD